MIQEIFPDLHKCEIPLPRSPLRAVNSYVFRGNGRFLIIDTGMKRPECHEAMLSCLKELNVDLKMTDFFITHIHTDHIGLVGDLATDGTKIFFNRTESSRLDLRKMGETVIDFYRQNGFPEEELKRALANHPGLKYHLQKIITPTIIDEGDVIEIGDYHLKCISTPGHSAGHMCLYDEKKRLFVSGDHVLQDVTPNISLTRWEINPLKRYLESLDKVSGIEAKYVLPGHGRVFHEIRKRTAELKQHHVERLNEIRSILDGKGKNTYKIASEMSWDVEYRTWEQFPPGQKWFAMGEALSHLKYLDDNGSIHSRKQDSEILFSLA